MKRAMYLVMYLMLLIGVVAVSLPAAAKEHKSTAKQEKLFQKGKHETVSGEITDVKTRGGRDNQGSRVVLTVKTGTGDQTVLIGPEAYLKDNHFDLKAHDQITVDGSLVDFHGHKVIMAQRLQHDQAELKLRDESGRPMWTTAAAK
ncbi:MAG TPA: hypothetical protein VGL38_09105 [bacterium]|jgi:uncharacterized membrane protein